MGVELKDLSAQKKAYVDALIEDFYGELNFIAGMPKRRYPLRTQLMGKRLTNLHATVPRTPFNDSPTSVLHTETTPLMRENTEKSTNVSVSRVPYEGIIQADNLMDMASLFFSFSAKKGIYWKEHTPDQMRVLAIYSVDRILEYMTCPDANGLLPSWDAQNFFKGLFYGDGRRWITAVPDAFIAEHLPPIVHDLLWISGSHEQQFWDDTLEEIPDTLNAQSDGVYALRLDDESDGYASAPRETTKALQESVKGFYTDFQRYVVNTDFSHDDNKKFVKTVHARLHRTHYRNPLTTSVTPSKTDEIKLVFELDEPSAEYVGASPKVGTGGDEKQFEGILDDWFKKPKDFTFFNRFFAKTIQYWLIKGNLVSNESILFQLIVRYLEQSDEATYIPVRIPMSQIHGLHLDFNEPFLPQYFIKGLGYNETGVMHLKNNHQFLFFFDGLDLLPSFDEGHEKNYKSLMERLYFGEETVDWSSCKVIFTASSDFVPPVRPYAISVQEGELVDLKNSDVDEWVSAPWNNTLNQAISEKEEIAHRQVADFFKDNMRELIPLVYSFGKQDSLPINTESEQWLALMNIKISPVLINLVMRLVPNLQALPPEQWPKNRHALYAFALDIYLGESGADIYPILSDIALTLFRQDKLVLKLPAQGDLLNFPFLSGTHVHETGSSYYRYAFTQIDFRDYLVAEILWRTRHLMEVLPEDNVWNIWHLEKKYPSVLHFLTEFLNTSESGLSDAVFLHQRWAANGPQSGSINAYQNAKAILDASEFTQEKIIEACENKSVPSQFLRTTASRQTRLLARLNPETYALVQKAAFDFLGNGCGVSAISADYIKKESREDDRRYIFANVQDRLLGEKLIKKAHEAINHASEENIKLISILVPHNWGFHERDAILQASFNLDKIDLIHAEQDYLSGLETAVFRTESTTIVSQEEALVRLKNFQKDQLAWLLANEAVYKEKSRNDARWYDQSGNYVICSEESLARRVAHYSKNVKEKLQNRVQWMKALIKQGEYKTLDQHCVNAQQELSDAENIHQDNITSIMQHSMQLSSETYQRFEQLMSLTPYTQTIFEAYTEEDKKQLREEINTGNRAIIQRFKVPFLLSRYGDMCETLEKIRAASRRDDFISWITQERKDDSLWTIEQWRIFQEQWKKADGTFRELFLKSLETGRLEAIQALFCLIFKVDESCQSLFEKYIHQTESLRFQGCVEQYIRNQSMNAVQVWDSLTATEKKKLYEQFEATLTDQDRLLTIVERYPDIFDQPSNHYILRYLRFGLSVDACCDNTQRTPLLFYALRRLGTFNEVIPSPATSHLYQIIQHLVNVGATVLVKNETSSFNTPRDYVTEQRILFPENSHWKEIEVALDTVMEWFELQSNPEEKLFYLMNQLLEFTEYYDSHILNVSNIDSLESVLAKIGQKFRPDSIEQDRRRTITTITEKAPHLLNDRFHLKQNLEQMMNDTRNAKRRVRMGRLNGGIHSKLEKVIQEFQEGIPTDPVTVTRYKINPTHLSTSPKKSLVDQFWGFLGYGKYAPDTQEIRKLKTEVMALRKVDEYKDKIIEEQNATITNGRKKVAAFGELLSSMTDTEEKDNGNDRERMFDDKTSRRSPSPTSSLNIPASFFSSTTNFGNGYSIVAEENKNDEIIKNEKKLAIIT